jgi:hypothetical protein
MFANNPDNIRWIAATALLFWSSLPTWGHGFAGGSGEPGDPYRVATAEQLISIGSDPNLLDKHFVLVNDVDLDPNLPAGCVFTRSVIGADTNDGFGFQGTGFTGRFDGNGHKIENLTIESALGYYVGLFANIGINGQVERLGVEGISIAGAHYCVGGLAGVNHGIIVACHTSGAVHTGERLYIESLGGLVGLNTGRIFHSYALTDVFGDSKSSCLGGLVGVNLWGRIVSCHAKGKVTGEDYLGGLAGNNVEGTITDCYARGSVSTEGFSLYSGGLVGRNQAGTIVNCYAATVLCNVNEEWDWGGLVGKNWPSAAAAGVIIKGAIANSFWDIEFSGVRVSDGGTGLATAQMYQQGTFVTWDFNDMWIICEGKDYPRLQWENVQCEE